LTDTAGSTSNVTLVSSGDANKLEARIYQDSQSGRLNLFVSGSGSQATQYVATSVLGTQTVQVVYEVQVTGSTSWQSDFIYAEHVINL